MSLSSLKIIIHFNVYKHLLLVLNILLSKVVFSMALKSSITLYYRQTHPRVLKLKYIEEGLYTF